MDNETNPVLIDRVGTDGRVARLTLNRPHVLNALSSELVGELHRTLRRVEADHSVRVVLLRGAGRAFSTGHDLADAALGRSAFAPDVPFTTRDDSGRPLTANVATLMRQVTDVQMYLFRMSKITMVQAHGFCIAGGLEFAMMADLVTASSDCAFGHPGHRGLGVARNGMLLPLIIGMRKAKELFFTGDEIDGCTAERLGLVNYAWPVDELEERTLAFADRVANLSSDYLGVLKTSINRFYEAMGVQTSVDAMTFMDAAIQQTETAYEWSERVRADGLKSALAWRDGRYGDYGARVRT